MATGTAPKKEPKCPKGEKGWVRYYNRAGEPIFLLTGRENSRDWYYLYEIADGGILKKLGRAHTPSELEEKFHVDERMRT